MKGRLESELHDRDAAEPVQAQREGPTLRAEMTRRSCPLCSSDDASRVFAESHVDPDRLDGFAFASRKIPEYIPPRLAGCPSCDLLSADPPPTIESVAEAYRDAASDSGEEAGYAARPSGRLLPPIARRLPARAGA